MLICLNANTARLLGYCVQPPRLGPCVVLAEASMSCGSPHPVQWNVSTVRALSSRATRARASLVDNDAMHAGAVRGARCAMLDADADAEMMTWTYDLGDRRNWATPGDLGNQGT